MAERENDAPRPADRELVITRVFAAPRALVFEAWTDAKGVSQWWGPKDFTLTHHELDIRPGGKWRVCMRSPEGVDHWARGVYREIVKPERVVLTWSWEEPEGTPGRETLVTVTLAELGAKKTKMTFRHAPFETVKDRDEHVEGWNESFDRLDKHLAKDPKGRTEIRQKEADMLGDKEGIATIAVKSVEAAGKFYGGKLGLKAAPSPEASVRTYKSGNSSILVYESPFAGTNKATAATWAVGDDLEGIVRDLQAKGVEFEKYDLPGLKREGVIHVGGNTRAAWFKDPDGNILAIVGG